ncbi:MAG: exopolysaccharide biosynthesis polyprenyl glycosylphosphotransferase [Parvularculaceae bacterium]
MATQALLALGLLVYYWTLKRPARAAALYAMPKRRGLWETKVGRKWLSYFLPNDAAPEHVSGQIDLDTFQKGQLSDSPVVRGDALILGAKRLLDVICSLALLAFMLPLLIITSIVIRVDSPGPVFYKQSRVGKNGKLFNVIKFRSMRLDAEKTGAQWATKSDPRVTRVGRFIRKTRIDEIPQAWNVLIGEMSFVGPRPERPEFTRKLDQQIPFYNDRHLVKPGLTGWAQVNYPYGASVEDAFEKQRLDLYYMKNFSLLLDLFIIIRTLRVAVKGVGSR